TDNVRFNTTGTTYLYGDVALGTLNFASQNATTVLNLGGNKLTVAGGGDLPNTGGNTQAYLLLAFVLFGAAAVFTMGGRKLQRV
ncbi:MAG: LPXTG cell wall anchor domain-containing protein, partial [Actinobacteria bacterium]|nr:LPXTG cell wall anchor domain-containing protein [Actinomycetota bacterium]